MWGWVVAADFWEEELRQKRAKWALWWTRFIIPSLIRCPLCHTPKSRLPGMPPCPCPAFPQAQSTRSNRLGDDAFVPLVQVCIVQLWSGKTLSLSRIKQHNKPYFIKNVYMCTHTHTYTHILISAVLLCLINSWSLPFSVAEEKICITAMLLMYCIDNDLQTWFHFPSLSLRPSLHLVCQGILFILQEQKNSGFGSWVNRISSLK
jgi:hypothetical protein